MVCSGSVRGFVVARWFEVRTMHVITILKTVPRPISWCIIACANIVHLHVDLYLSMYSTVLLECFASIKHLRILQGLINSQQ